MAILDQENAKKFLCGSGTEKYEFFKKATDLARIDATYGSTQVKLEELNHGVEQMNTTLAQKREAVTEAKNKVKEHDELDKLKAKLQEAETLYAWSFHKAAASEHQNATEAVEKYEAKVKHREEEIAEFEKSFSQESTTDEEAKRRQVMDDLIQEVQLQTVNKQQLESQFKKEVVPVKQLEKERQLLRNVQEEIKQQLCRSKDRLNDMRVQISARGGSEEAQRLQTLNVAEMELQQLKLENPEMKQAVSTSLRAYEELTPHVRDASMKVDSIQRQLGGVASRIRDLEVSSADSLTVLGPNVKKVYDMVSDKQNLDHYTLLSTSNLIFVPDPAAYFFRKIQRSSDRANSSLHQDLCW